MKKIIDAIKKLLGMSDKPSSDSSSGFTLIELLVVIAVIGILAAALLIAIDPIDKINAGNDTKVQSNLRSEYDAALRYYTNNSVIPATTTLLTSSGELKSLPTNPSGYNAYNYYPLADDVIVCGQVKSKAQKQKAVAVGGAIPASANLFITSGRVCYTTGACGAGLTITGAGVFCF